MKVVAFVPVKGSSERVPSKNTRPFKGEPLFAFTVRKLLRCKSIDEVYVDSEDSEILEFSKAIGAIPLPRDSKLATNKTDGNQLFYNEVKQIDADIYIQHLCTSPFIYEETIEKSIEELKSNNKIDSIVLGAKTKDYNWKDNKPVYDIENIPNSIDLPDSITEAMGLYLVKKEAAQKSKRRIGYFPKMIFGSSIELIDVNTEGDLKLATAIVSGILSQEEKRLKIIGRFLTSPTLSDVVDELGLDCVLPPEYRSNIPGVRMFGRARPLHIRVATENDDEQSIYKALQSYNQVVSNDIIIVKNDMPHLAYFGDLNMSLSIRSGAVGAIIGGVTRDNRSTANAGFPVFAKGRYCKDIKGKGAVESINKPIVMDDILINPSDLIFADEDGIVVIPRKYEDEIIKRAIEVMGMEKKIIAEICKDVSIPTLLENHGFF